jgi:methanogenic corrinoid protein MtbC1
MNSAADSAGVHIDAVLGAIDRYDSLGCLEALRVAAQVPSPVLVAQILAPLLHEAGARWRAGRYTIAQEHMLSSAVLRLLCAELDRHNGNIRPDAPTVAFTTLSGDRHGMGALIAAVVAAEHGVRALHLGADMPVGELVVLAEHVPLRAVALSIIAQPSVIDAQDQILELRGKLPTSIEIWIGGAGGGQLDPAALPADSFFMSTIDIYVERLRALAR